MVSEKAYDVEQRLNNHLYQHRYIMPCTASNAISTSLGTVPGLTAALDASPADYTFYAFIGMQFTTSGGTLSYSCSATGGLTLGSYRMFAMEFEAGGTFGAAGTTNSFGTSVTGSNVASGLADRYVIMQGRITPAVGGNLNIQCALSSGAGTYYKFGTYLDIIQTN